MVKDNETKQEEKELDLQYDEDSLQDIDEWKAPKDEKEDRLYAINVRLSEIESLKFSYEETFESDNPSMSEEEYYLLINEENSLYKEIKEINKQKKKSLADNTPLWVILYGIIQAVISSPIMIYIQIKILQMASNKTWINELFVDTNVFTQDLIVYTILFLPPVLNFLITLVIYFALKKDTYSKRSFKYVMFGHLTIMIISSLIAVLRMF